MTAMERIADDAAATSRHVYPASAMIGDYLRTAAGLVPSGLLLATVPTGAVAGTVLGGFAAIFAVFGLRTALRHGTSIAMSETQLCAGGARRCVIAWAELDRLKLAYYSTHRDRKSGWMQLELAAGGAKLKLDSRIEGFDRLVRRAAEAAVARGVLLSDATVGNLEALGIGLPPSGADR